MAARCQYQKSGPCAVETQYLNAVSAPILRLLQDPDIPALTEVEFLDFGLKLLPLYHDLIRVKLAIAALSNVVLSSKSHGVRVHPLYKERREILRAIEGLDITNVLREKFRDFNMKDITPRLSSEELERDGDPDFADSLMGGR